MIKLSTLTNTATDSKLSGSRANPTPELLYRVLPLGSAWLRYRPAAASRLDGAHDARIATTPSDRLSGSAWTGQGRQQPLLRGSQEIQPA